MSALPPYDPTEPGPQPDAYAPSEPSAPPWLASLRTLPTALRSLMEALSLLPELGFSFVAAQHAAGIKPRLEARIAGLDESVYGPAEGAPLPSTAELHLLRSQLDELSARDLLQSSGETWRMRGPIRQALGVFDKQPYAVRLAEGFAGWLEAHPPPQAMLEEEASWRRALELALEVNALALYSWMLTLTCGPGGWFHRRRELAVAQKLIEQGLKAHGYPESIQPDPLLANILFLRGGLLRLENRLDEAAQALEDSSQVADTCKLTREFGMARGELAAIRMQQLRFDEAIPLFHEKMAAMQTAHDPAEFAETCGDLAEALVIKGEHLEALDLLEQRLGLQQAMQNPRGVALTRATLGDILADLNRFQDAVANYQLALPELEKLDPRNAAVARANMGIYQTRLGDRQGALTSFKAARAVFVQYRLTNEIQMIDGYLQDLWSEN